MADISISVGVVVDDAGIDQINSKIANMAQGMSSDLGTAEISTKGLESAIGSMSKVVQDLDGTVGKLGGGMTNLGRKTNDAERAVTRQVFAQRAALSSANNLTRSMTQLATGSGGAAASFGIVTRQLALLSTSAAGTGLTLKALAASFLGPAGIAIGISVAVTAITGFITSANNKKKAIEGLDTSLGRYIDRLGLVAGLEAQGTSNAQKSITSLNLLYGAINNVSLSTEDRNKAIVKLQKEYPSYFANLTREQILAGEGKDAYDKLTASILASAQARAYEQRIADNSVKVFDNQTQVLDANQKLIPLYERRNKLQSIFNEQLKAGNNNADATASRIRSIDKEIAALGASQNKIASDNARLTTESSRLIEEVYNKVKLGADIFDTTTKSIKDQKIEIDALEGSLKKLQETRALLQERLIKENDLEAQKAYTAQITALDAEILKVTNSLRALKIASDLAFKGMTTTELLMEKSVNNALEDLKAFHTELNKIRDKGSFNPFDLSGIKTSDQVRMDANKEAGEPFSATLWKSQLKGLEEANKTNLKGANELSRTLSRGFHSAGRDMLTILTGFNEMVDKSFANIFSTLANGLTRSFNDLFLRIISDRIKNKLLGNITEAGENVGASLNKGASRLMTVSAGLALAGQAISGIFPKTSTVGQGLGGALSGVGTGAMIGSVIPGIGTAVGGIVGGLVGALGGIFGASKAKKEARIQEQQLLEQQKQTELMERQNAMSFLQSIVGRMVDGVGVINNADISWDGKLVTEVSGRNLKFILEREENASKRGV